MMGRGEAVAKGAESNGGREPWWSSGDILARGEREREPRGRMGGGGRRRSLQAVVCRAAAGRHGGAWSVVAFLASCAACASRERVRPAAWRRRGAGLSRHPLCPLVRGKKKCVLRGCVASVRLSRARARWWEGGVRFGSACGTHPCRPPPPFVVAVCREEREKKCTRAEEGGRSRLRAVCARRERFSRTKGGGAPFEVCSRSV